MIIVVLMNIYSIKLEFTDEQRNPSVSVVFDCIRQFSVYPIAHGIRESL